MKDNISNQKGKQTLRYFVIDGETCETPRDEKGQLDVNNGQVYNLGGQVIDDDGSVLTEVSFINYDVFFGMPLSMQEAYYADKIPQYRQEMKDRKHKIVNTWQMRREFYNICKDFNVDYVVAHNARFDILTLNATLRYQTKSKRRYFLPYGMKVLDTMKFARDFISTDPDYISFCIENGYMTNTKKPRPKLTAEVLWRYLSKNNEFIEEHTGLEDVKIEKEILLECLKRGARPET